MSTSRATSLGENTDLILGTSLHELARVGPEDPGTDWGQEKRKMTDCAPMVSIYLFMHCIDKPHVCMVLNINEEVESTQRCDAAQHDYV